MLAYFSFKGPSYDGRIKPEVCALGVGVAAANPGGGYSVFYNGTSASSPLLPVLRGFVKCKSAMD
ncbi:MAG: hypothetical protein CM1200mP10_09280 [Candidatus Neomarinimicrobiota bacterium]|nr:MAG: hypothetical protein CM1200mP10_09280 [Candidatus Neomarinimicrobiota bacterium]